MTHRARPWRIPRSALLPVATVALAAGTFIANQIDQPDTALPVAAWNPPPQGQQAPPAPVHNGKSYYFKVVAQQDGTFTVTNMRNNFSKTYRPGVANATR